MLENVPHFNVSNFLSRAKIYYADINPIDNPVYTRTIKLGECTVELFSKYDKITDVHARKVHNKLKGAIWSTLNEQH